MFDNLREEVKRDLRDDLLRHGIEDVERRIEKDHPGLGHFEYSRYDRRKRCIEKIEHVIFCIVTIMLVLLLIDRFCDIFRLRKAREQEEEEDRKELYQKLSRI